jgi:hypothetical protein
MCLALAIEENTKGERRTYRCDRKLARDTLEFQVFISIPLNHHATAVLESEYGEATAHFWPIQGQLTGFSYFYERLSDSRIFFSFLNIGEMLRRIFFSAFVFSDELLFRVR